MVPTSASCPACASSAAVWAVRVCSYAFAQQACMSRCVLRSNHGLLQTCTNKCAACLDPMSNVVHTVKFEAPMNTKWHVCVTWSDTVQVQCKLQNQMYLSRRPDLQLPLGQVQKPLLQMGCTIWVSLPALQASTRSSQASQQHQTRKISHTASYARKRLGVDHHQQTSLPTGTIRTISAAFHLFQICVYQTFVSDLLMSSKMPISLLLFIRNQRVCSGIIVAVAILV